LGINATDTALPLILLPKMPKSCYYPVVWPDQDSGSLYVMSAGYAKDAHISTVFCMRTWQWRLLRLRGVPRSNVTWLNVANSTHICFIKHSSLKLVTLNWLSFVEECSVPG
jgi:hypothetical protein